MSEWKSERLPLPRDHAWTARPGRRVFVADRGAVRFDVPQAWIIGPGEGGSVQFHNRQPPDDDCRLELSVLRFPPLPGGGPPLAELLQDLGSDPDLDVIDVGRPLPIHRPGLELAWAETLHRDRGNGDEALARTCLARGGGIHALLTMSLWVADAPRFDPVWHEVLETLEVGARYDISGRDPRRN